MRVLIVEDRIDLAVRLTEFVSELGHVVVSLAGIAEIDGDCAHGPGLDLSSRVECGLKGFDLAFLDHYFLSERHNGATIAKELSLRGCTCIVAISSDEAANHRMRQQGAHLAVRKADLARMLGA
jgi:DNA-binding response OmpR family regulator